MNSLNTTWAGTSAPRTMLALLVPNTCGRATHRWAWLVHGPRASTTTSAGWTAPSMETPVTAPDPSSTLSPSTTPVTNSAPPATASSASARVKPSGFTCAVVAGPPITSWATTLPSSHSGFGKRR